MRDVTVKAAGPDAPITSLSGGNQQKVVLGKALLTEPRVLLLDEPTRGIDVGAKADIFELMTELAGRGLAVLFATSELDEALHVPDRLLVMAKGKVVREVRRGAATREEIMVASEGSERMTRRTAPTSAPPMSVADAPATGEGRRLQAFNVVARAARIHRADRDRDRVRAALGRLSDVGQPRHDDQARRDQRDLGHRDADGHPDRRHRPLGRLDRRARRDRRRRPARRACTSGSPTRSCTCRCGASSWSSLAVGTGVGAFNGTLVTRFNVAPFIATLGTLYMARGVALLISDGEDLPEPRRQPAARQHRFRLPRYRPTARHPDLDLADGAVRGSPRSS